MILLLFSISKIPFDSSFTPLLLLCINWGGLGYCTHCYFYWSLRIKSITFSSIDYYFRLIPPPFDSGGFRVHLLLRSSIFYQQHILYIRTTIKITADDASCSSYGSVFATDLTVCTTVTDTDIDTLSCDPDNAFFQQL